MFACQTSDSLIPNPDPVEGETEFLSADSQSGDRSKDNGYGAEDDLAAADAEGSNDGSDRTVEEGDIYRVIGDYLIVNLNSYRGLQIIDFSNVNNPEIVGRLRVSGTPVEMYVVGTRAIILMNNWRGYYGSRSSINVDSYTGGLVLAVDIQDPENPVITDRAQVPGYILTSRLTRGGGQEAVYVAANDWGSYENNWEYSTVVRSFSIEDDGELETKSTINLGGYVRDIQATPEALLVARYDWNLHDYQSTVALIDISNPDGTMVEGSEILVAGMVEHKSRMNLYKGILRVVSGSTWSGTQTNHLQTYNVADISNPIAVDHDTFGAGERLFATIFVENKAFFVTYLQVDPFHAFEIDDQGNATAKVEYVISGWNDFFRTVYSNTRLIGIGMNDENSRTMAVSLYDISDLENPEPFIARAEVSADSSWSEARWDDRAFSVLENAVSVENDDGVLETGLVLLPYSGYSSNYEDYFAGVQIFTFSENSLTPRGSMNHGTQVRRSFLANESTSANLSEAELSLFDHTSPDDPQELGRVELAPNYTDLFIYGDHTARLKYKRDYYGWYDYYADSQNNELEIVPADQDPDTALAVASVEIPINAQVVQVQALAASIQSNWEYNEGENDYDVTTIIQLYDLSDPTNPEPAGTLETDQIQYSGYGYYYPGWGGMEDDVAVGGIRDMAYYPYYGYGASNVYSVGDSLVFASNVWESELEGMEHYCHIYPEHYYDEKCEVENPETGYVDCVYYSGGITCTSLNGGPTTCSGSIQRCTTDGDGEYDCVEVDPNSIPTTEYCYDYERYRYWSHFDINIVDVTDPNNPVLHPTISMPTEENAAGILVDGSTLYISYSIPYEVENDTRPYARYYFKTIDLSDPANPSVGSGINVPGQLIQVDGNIVYTRDFVWGDEIVETALNKLIVEDGLAYLQARRRFIDQEVHTMLLDGLGHALVTHQLSWRVANEDPNFSWEDRVENLTILDVEGDDFPILSTFEVDNWASLQGVEEGRALFSVPGGLLVVNVVDPTEPFAQAYFSTLGWPTKILINAGEIMFAAGRYGIYSFGLDVFNLLSE
jgi:hypothetical protein